MSKAWEQTLDNEMSQQETFVRFGDVENGNYIQFNEDGTQEIFVNFVSTGSLASSYGQTASGPMGGSGISALPKKVDIGSTNKWLFESDTAGDVSDEIGDKPFTIKGTSTIANDATDVYDPSSGRTTQIASRRTGDLITFGNSLKCNNTAGDGAVADNTETFLPFDQEWTIVAWFVPLSFSTGYVWAQSGSGATNRFGFLLEGSNLKFRCFGADQVVIPEADSGDIGFANIITLSNYWDGSAFKFKYSYNGAMGAADLDSVRNAKSGSVLPITVGARHSTDSAGSALAYPFSGSIGKVSIYDRNLLDSEHESIFWNPHLQNVCTGIGSSSLAGVGPTSIDDALFYRLDDRYRTRTNCIFWNRALGGSTFYNGVPDDYENPSFITDSRPSGNTGRNITDASERKNSDIVICWFASNFSGESNQYYQGPRYSTESMYAYAAMQKEAQRHGSLLLMLTPTPYDGTGAGGIARGDVAKEVSEDMLTLGLNVIDTFVIAADGANTVDARYYVDGTHTNEYSHATIEGSVIKALEPIMKLTELTQA